MRAIVRDMYGSPDVLELPHQALGFRVQAYGVTQQKDLFTRRQLEIPLNDVKSGRLLPMT